MFERLGNIFHIGQRPSIHDSVMVEMVALSGPAHETLGPRLRSRQLDTLNAETYPHSLPDHVGIATHAGMRRRNEDSAATLIAWHVSDQGRLPIILAAVADGMGGQAAGDQAGATTIETLVVELLDGLLSPTSGPREPLFEQEHVEQLLVDAVTEAHHSVVATTPQGGSTLTCALLIGDVAYVAHVGDSRAYLLDEDGLELLTRDHLMVRYLQGRGLVTEEAAAVHPHRHILYRAIGVTTGHFSVDTTIRHLKTGDGLLLCTDGVWGVLSDDSLEAHLRVGFPAQVVCESVVEDALRHNSPDNLTAALIQNT